MIQAPGQSYFLIQTLSLVTPSLYTGGCLGAPSFFKDLAPCSWRSFFHLGLYIDVPSSLLLSFSSWVPSLGAPSFFKDLALNAPSFFMDLALEAPSSLWFFIMMCPLPCCSLYPSWSFLFLNRLLSEGSSLLKGLLSWCSLFLPLFVDPSLPLLSLSCFVFLLIL